MKKIVLLLVLPMYLNLFAEQPSTIVFKSKDGLKVTADLYVERPTDSPFIILFHQAGWSRGEYLEIAPKLNQLGYNCMAVDQRSGEVVNNVVNETAKRAVEKGLSTEFMDAVPDMMAAINYVQLNYNPSKLIIWGSSYSSTLVLKIAADHPSLVDAVLAFAPGEYSKYFGKSGNWIAPIVDKIQIPVFITSAKSEYEIWKGIYEAIGSTHKRYFLPESDGNHGSKALWSRFDDSLVYWEAVKEFLSALE
ncbi:alpha/beta hydrolase [Carboxylicivirga taeanensis]|uniref:alpha/beta hydrolase n=1 Tax=Carboxylicivirga taeanensis TaxID=1416875 RepID=UPI003F6DE3C9